MLTTPGHTQQQHPSPAGTLSFQSSNLPIVIINTHDEPIPNDHRIFVDMGIIYNGEGRRNRITDPFNHYNGKINIEIRGSSSTMFPKKQYAFETQDSSGNNLNVSLLNLPEENDWILYAPYSDKSLMRNVLIYNMAGDMGHYASGTKYCELVLNGDYRGVYVLMEKIKRDKNRVDISTLNPDEINGDDVTGGYIIKVDKMEGERIDGWYATFLPYPGAWQQTFYQYHYPKPGVIVTQQKQYIRNFIFRFEQMMNANNYADPQTGYPVWLDLNSFVDYFIINEASKNVDGYRLSMFLYKDRDSIDPKLHAGPVWDFNLAFGNADYYDGAVSNGWMLDYLTENQYFKSHDGFCPPFWWKRLWQDEKFRDAIFCRWRELREHVLNLPLIFHEIDSITVYLKEARIRNFNRWPILSDYVWPNAYIGGTYENEINYLKQWLAERFNWIDENLTGKCQLDTEGEKKSVPDTYYLMQNYPSPFRSETRIEYGLSSAAMVKISVYNLLGREVRQLVDQFQPSGNYEINWDGTDQFLHPLPAGLYLYRLHAAAGKRKISRVKKVIIIR